jgi:sulfur carrier protein
VILCINGKQDEVNDRISIDSLVEERGLDRETIVIEYNLEVISKDKWSRIFPQDGDKIEIVRFMGGG